jgi:GTPase SAR1 family protein
MHLTRCTTAGLRVRERLYHKINKGAIVVFDTTDADTFKKMNQWVKELKSYLPNEIPIIIAGNKADLNNKAIEED